ncbi:PQQ-dependent sugar dehydrogenase [Flavobacteriaceae bacterium]|nr:PQQ-dependent sugar dehydrogenase [Flavobacteriaceae bacterium]
MNIRIIILFSALLISCTEDTAVFNIPSTDPDNGGLILPKGFGALVVADSVGPARHLAVNTNGDIYIKLRIDTGDKGNMALRDIDGDGKADIFKRFGDYPNDGRFATEMKIHNDYLYYSSELVVYRQKLDPTNLIPKGKPEVIMVDEYPIRWHNAKSLAFDNKGGMYVTFSAPTNACEDLRLTAGDPDAVVKGEFPCSQLNILGGVWKFDENKLEQRQSDGIRFATGLRSIVGITWNKKEDNLYAVNHGRDYLHNHAPDYYSKWENSVLPSEEFMLIKKDDDFGWPYTYYDHFKNKRMLAPEYGGDGKQQAKGYAEPIMGLPAHWAPNDLMFYTGSQFPDRYKDGAFIAFHGSTNRGPYPQAGYIVAFIPFENGKPSGNLEVFADGFTGTDLVKQMKDSKYRPMGLAQGPDGSLYISESKNGKIWRVIFNGDKLNFDNEALKQMESLKQKSHLRIPDKELDLQTLK